MLEQQLPTEVTVAQAIGGDTGASGLQGVAGELANMQGTGAGSNTITTRWPSKARSWPNRA